MRRLATPEKYSHIDFKPPESVANAAEKGLEYRKKQGEDKAGLTPEEASKEGIGSGVQRAVNLKNRDEVSPETINKMVGFFARHEKNSKIDAKHKGEPWKDKGYVSWLLWGGDPGKTWAEKVKRQMEAADEKAKKKTARRVVARYLALKEASENEPTNPKLWEKVQKLTKGEIKSLKHDGKTIEGPNDGKGFDVFPSAYANGWASKVYDDLGGGWKKKGFRSTAFRRAKGRGKSKKDVGHGGLDEWFSGHGKGKGDGKGEEATWGDWVAISPVKKKLENKTVNPGDIVGPCAQSDNKDWKELTNDGKDPLKCMPRQKAYDMPKKERAEKAKEKMQAEKKDSDRGKEPTRTPTFKDKKKAVQEAMRSSLR